MNARAVMCSLDGIYNSQGAPAGSISASTCKSMYANLLVARASGQTLQLMMDGDSMPAQCGGFGEWVYVSLRYVANLP